MSVLIRNTRPARTHLRTFVTATAGAPSVARQRAALHGISNASADGDLIASLDAAITDATFSAHISPDRVLCYRAAADLLAHLRTFREAVLRAAIITAASVDPL